MKNFFLIFLATFFFTFSKGENIRVQSPDGKIQVNFGIDELHTIFYSVSVENSTVIQNSHMGFQIQEIPDFGKNLEIVSFSETEVNQVWKPVYGERSEIKDHYKQLKIQLRESGQNAQKFDITFRVYNEGIAFNYTFPSTGDNEKLYIQKELTEFKLNGNYDCWASERAQSEIQKIPVNSISKPVERPLIIELKNFMLALGEARLVDFARMKFIAGENPNSLVASLESEAIVTLPYTTPWRTIMIGKSAGELLEKNYFIENLNDACAIKDVSWIKPGKVIREVTLTTRGGLACVDFAAENG